MNVLTRKTKLLKDEYVEYALKMYDIPPSEYVINEIELVDMSKVKDFNIFLLIGASGSGKSTIMNEQFKDFTPISEDVFDLDKALISNFTHCSVEDAGKALSMCGLSSIPSWLKPYRVLSEGQKARALCAYFLSKYDKVRIDEFTSTVNREVAKSLSYSVQKYIKSTNKKVVLCSCHYDIVDWLSPDYLYDVNLKTLIDRRSLRQINRPKIDLTISKCSTREWKLFSEHHYLSASINKGAKCFIAFWNKVPVAFSCFLPQPNSELINCWRESRTVVLPDFQGLGIGSKFSELIGGALKNEGHDYLSKTTHPSFFNYRERSPNWELYSKGTRNKEDMGHNAKIKIKDELFGRYCYSHRYVGDRFKNSKFLQIKPPIEEKLVFDEQFISPLLSGEKVTTVRNYKKRKGVILRCVDTKENFICRMKLIKVEKTKDMNPFLLATYGKDATLYKYYLERI